MRVKVTGKANTRSTIGNITHQISEIILGAEQVARVKGSELLDGYIGRVGLQAVVASQRAAWRVMSHGITCMPHLRGLFPIFRTSTSQCYCKF